MNSLLRRLCFMRFPHPPSSVAILRRVDGPLPVGESIPAQRQTGRVLASGDGRQFFLSRRERAGVRAGFAESVPEAKPMVGRAVLSAPPAGKRTSSSPRGAVRTPRPTRVLLALLTLITAHCSLITSSQAAPAPFELKDGDRVVFLGDTFIEREQYYGWIELMLTTRFPDRNVTFRNLGWSADTPAGDSRFGLSVLQAGKEPADEGWKMLVKQLEDAKPTVVFVGYGMASSFDGEAGLPKFKADYNRLLDTIEKISPGVRLVLLSPIVHEQLGVVTVGQ